MATRRTNDPNARPAAKRRPPATTREGREQQLIAYAVDLAEEQLTSGTASAQVISHYLKMSSSREALEQERIRQEVGLLKIKAETIASEKRVEELYGKALAAMSSYKGESPPEEDDDY